MLCVTVSPDQKGGHMKKIVLTAILGVAVAIGFTVAEVPVFAQEAQTLEGAWRVTVTIRNCQTGMPMRTVPALNTFVPGGSMFETANGFFRSPSHGTWQKIAGHDYTATFMFFTFNPDGSWLGSNKITRTITLSGDHQTFTAIASFGVFDANGKLITTGCATETAERFE
jgi:hypothetical protein